MTKQLIITDENAHVHKGADGAIIVNGEAKSFGCIRNPHRMRSAPGMSLAKAGIPLINKADFLKEIKQLYDDGADLKTLTYDLDALDQGERGQCHIYGNCGAMRTLSRKQGGVLRCPSAQSVAWAMYGGRSWGNLGDDPGKSFEALIESGAARSELWPMDADGQSRRCATEEAEADRENNRLIVGVELGIDNDMWTEIVSCARAGIPMAGCWDEWGHHTEIAGVAIVKNALKLLGRNSWTNDYGDRGFYILDTRWMVPDNAWAFIQMTQAS